MPAFEQTPIYRAFMNGSDKRFQDTISSGVSLEIRSSNKASLVILASIFPGKLSKLRILIKEDADLNLWDNQGQTAIMLACAKENNHEVIEALIEGGADVNIPDNDGITPLISVSEKSDPRYLNMLIKAGARLNDANKFGATAVMQASNKPEYFKCLNVLIKAGANVNIRDKAGDNAIIYTASVLVPSKKDIEKVKSSGQTPNNLNQLNLKALIRAGINIDNRNREGLTALMQFVKVPNLFATVKILIDEGADINVLDKKKWTAFNYACLDASYIKDPVRQ